MTQTSLEPAPTKERSNMVNARIAAHLTQKQVAEKMKVGVRSINNWERAHTTPYLSQIEGLREAIKFTGTDEELLHVFIVKKPEDTPDQESCEADNCQQVTTDQQLSPPCQTTENHDILESADPPPFVIPGAAKEVSLMDKLRRTLAKLGVSLLIGGTEVKLVPAQGLTPVIAPEEFLAQSTASIEACWQLLDHKGFSKVERVLSTTMPTLVRLAITPSEYQDEAAALATQGKMQHGIIASHLYRNFAACEIATSKAVEFGEFTSDLRIRAAAMLDHAMSYINCCLQNPDKAIPIFLDALHLINGSKAMLQQCDIYVCLANAYALNEDEEGALDALEQAEKIILSKDLDTRQDLVWLYGQGFADFRTMKGKAYLKLAPHFTENNYFQDAYDAFSMPVNSQMTTRGSSAIAIAQADALRGLGDMNECLKMLGRGLHTGIEINSLKRIGEANDVISNMPNEWKQEAAVQKLQKDITHAIVVARR